MPVSVIIPNYNAAPYLAQCLASVASDPAVSEIVIYDNDSTDDSLAVIDTLGIAKVRLIQGQENQGATMGRHLAVQASRTDLLFFLDADDFVSDYAVSGAASVLAQNNLGLSLFEERRVNEDGSITEWFIPAPEQVVDGETAFKMSVPSWRIHPRGVLRRTVYEAAASRFKFHGYSDDELLTRCILLDAGRVAGGGGVYYYRVVPKSASREMLVGRLQTQLGVLGLTSELANDEPLSREQRNRVTRMLLGLLRRTVTADARMEDVRVLFSEFDKFKMRWTLRDLPFFLATQLVRLAVARR